MRLATWGVEQWLWRPTSRPSPNTATDRRRARTSGGRLALLSFGAAALHFAYAPTHFDEYWLYGVFFVTLAWAQLAWGLAVLIKPSRVLLYVGLLNVVVIALYLLSRTVGVGVGPMASTTEPFGFPDTSVRGARRPDRRRVRRAAVQAVARASTARDGFVLARPRGRAPPSRSSSRRARRSARRPAVATRTATAARTPRPMPPRAPVVTITARRAPPAAATGAASDDCRDRRLPVREVGPAVVGGSDPG